MSDVSTIVIYHANCADGFCAAWVFWLTYKGDAEYLPMQHGDPPPYEKLVGKRVFIVDFSWKRPEIEKIFDIVDGLVVLDHHITAEQELAGLPYCRFDVNKSGGRLAWEYLNPGKPAPWLVEYTEDRDLWRHQLLGTKEVNAALRARPYTFEEWTYISGISHWTIMNEGEAILRYQRGVIEAAKSHAPRMEFAGYEDIPVVNTTTLISEIVGELAVGRPFAVGWFINAEGKAVYSLRSAPDGVNVAEIAKRYGGGGHQHAAGFTLEFSSPALGRHREGFVPFVLP